MSESQKEKLNLFSDHGRLTKEGYDFTMHARNELSVLVNHAKTKLTREELRMLECSMKAWISEDFFYAINDVAPWADE